MRKTETSLFPLQLHAIIWFQKISILDIKIHFLQLGSSHRTIYVKRVIPSGYVCCTCHIVTKRVSYTCYDATVRVLFLLRWHGPNAVSVITAHFAHFATNQKEALEDFFTIEISTSSAAAFFFVQLSGFMIRNQVIN